MTNKPQNINQLTTSLVPKNSRVLDLGCGNGALGEILQKKFNCQVIGVDSNSKLLSVAKRKLNKIILGNLDENETLYKIAKEPEFDVIFASAILEHLQKPELVVKKLSKRLKKNGFFLITLPNVAFWQIRLNLLFGKFGYTHSGILDKTHLHFFTIKSATAFLKEECHLSVHKLEYEFPPTPIIHKIARLIPRFGQKLENSLHKNFPNLFAYQIAIVAKPE